MPIDDKIKVFDAEDKYLKLLGELLSNDTSRKIIRMLIQKESYTNEISKKLDIRVSLVIHHLKKLEQLGVLEITHKQIVRKGNDHRYFRMVPGIFLMPNETKEEIHKSGFLGKIFREGIKLTMVGVASFFMLEFFHKSYDIPKGKISLNQKVYPLPEDSIFTIESLIWIPIIIIVCGILLIWFKKIRKKRK